MTPTGPSRPHLPPKESPPPTPHSAALETERQRIGQEAKKRKGYSSTALTAGISLGEPATEKMKAERLGITGA